MQAWSVARPGLTAEKSFSLYAIAGAITLLLFAGIRDRRSRRMGSSAAHARPSHWAVRPPRQIAWPLWQSIGISLGHFQRERYAEAIDAARRAIQSSPNLSTLHVVSRANRRGAGSGDTCTRASARLHHQRHVHCVWDSLINSNVIV